MTGFLRKSEPYFFYAIIGVFILLGFLHILTGYADNGDFIRSAGFIFERPAGFSTMLPSAGNEEWRRRFFSEGHDKWVFLSIWPNAEAIFSYSSYKIYLLGQVYLAKLFSVRNADYSIMLGSLVSRFILYTSFIIIVRQVRRSIPMGFSILFVILFGSIIIDSNWIAFVNSFYEDQIAIIGLPAMGALILLFQKKPNNRIGIFILLCAAFIGFAKTAYFYFPLFTVLFLIPFIGSRRRVVIFISISIVLQIASFMPIFFGKYGNINSYHALYFGALKVLPEKEALSIQSIGDKPIFHECIGVWGFGSLGQKCMEISRASYTDVVKLVVERPSIVLKMIHALFESGRTIRLEYLGKGIDGNQGFSNLPIFNMWQYLFNGVINYFAVMCFVVSLYILLSKKSGNSNNTELVLINLFYLLFGLSQYLFALGDGYYEIFKHLSVANYSIALSVPFMIVSVISFVCRGGMRSRPQIGQRFLHEC